MIFLGKSECSICGQVLRDGDDLVSTTHFIHDSAHPLWRFSDTGMHWACFIGWEHAAAFREAFDTLWPRAAPRHPRKMLADGSIVEV